MVLGEPPEAGEQVLPHSVGVSLNTFGFDDVDFESAEFSRKWHVGAQDREFAYQVFHPKMIEYFGSLRGFRLFTRGRYALYRVGSGQMDAEEMGTVFRYAKGFHERLPRFVRKDRAL